MRQIARHVGQQHVIGHVGGNHQTDTGQQAAPVFGRNLLERHFWAILQPFTVALFQLFNVLLERRRLFQGVTQVKTDDAKRQRQEERNTPAPVEEVLFTHYG